MKHTRVVSTKCTPGFACRTFSDTTLVCFIVNEHTTKCSHYTLLRVSATQHSPNASTVSETIAITELLVVLHFRHYIFQNSVDYAECSNIGRRTYSFRNMLPYTIVINRWRDVYEKNKSPDILYSRWSGVGLCQKCGRFFFSHCICARCIIFILIYEYTLVMLKFVIYV